MWIVALVWAAALPGCKDEVNHDELENMVGSKVDDQMRTLQEQINSIKQTIGEWTGTDEGVGDYLTALQQQADSLSKSDLNRRS